MDQLQTNVQDIHNNASLDQIAAKKTAELGLSLVLWPILGIQCVNHCNDRRIDSHRYWERSAVGIGIRIVASAPAHRAVLLFQRHRGLLDNFVGDGHVAFELSGDNRFVLLVVWSQYFSCWCYPFSRACSRIHLTPTKCWHDLREVPNYSTLHPKKTSVISGFGFEP